MDIVLDGLTGGLGRCLEQRSHIDVEAAVGIAGGYNLGTTVVTVLTHLSYKDTWTATLTFCKFLGQLAGFLKVGVVLTF